MPKRALPKDDGADRAEVSAIRSSTGATVEVMRTWYRTQTFPRHTHEYYTIGVMLRGVGTLWSGGTTRILRRGDVVVIPPGEVHTGGLGGDDEVLSYLAMHVPDDTVAGCAAAHDLPCSDIDVEASATIRDSAIAAELRRLDRAVDARLDETAGDAVTAVIDLVVSRFAQRSATAVDYRSQRGQPAFVQTVRQLIEDCYADNGRTSLETLAAAAGVSPFHLVREFTRAVGLSPHRYVTQTRIRRARGLLAEGMPPSFVAANTGFVDQSHLTTQFKRYVGMTPASYQRSRGIRTSPSTTQT
jgi:AraC-like DNA-binding protein/quercetin dioxygenase-like cupin family protein